MERKEGIEQCKEIKGTENKAEAAMSHHGTLPGTMVPTLVAEMGKSPPQVAIHAVVVAEVAVASKAVTPGTLPVLQQNMKATAVPAAAAGARLPTA